MTNLIESVAWIHTIGRRYHRQGAEVKVGLRPGRGDPQQVLVDLGRGARVWESSSYQRPVRADTVKVRSRDVPPVGAVKLSRRTSGARDVFARQVPPFPTAARVQLQPRGLVTGQLSIAPYLMLTTTGLVCEGTLTVSSRYSLPEAGAALPPGAVRIVIAPSSRTGVWFTGGNFVGAVLGGRVVDGATVGDVTGRDG